MAFINAMRSRPQTKEGRGVTLGATTASLKAVSYVGGSRPGRCTVGMVTGQQPALPSPEGQDIKPPDENWATRL